MIKINNKILLLIIAVMLIITLCFSACTSVKYRGPVSCEYYNPENGAMAIIDLTDEAMARVVSVLNSGKWVAETPQCYFDFEFRVNNSVIKYHSDCGTFRNVDAGTSMKLSEQEREEFNAMFVTVIKAESAAK